MRPREGRREWESETGSDEADGDESSDEEGSFHSATDPDDSSGEDDSDSDDGIATDPDDSSGEDEKRIAEEEMLGQLIEMYMTSELSAMIFCILCWHASRAGISGGPTERYAMAPGKRVHRYQRKLNKELGYIDFAKQFMVIDVPGQTKHDMSRTSLKLPILVPHEALEAEVASDPTILARLEDFNLQGSWDSIAFADHVVVRQPGLPAVPLVLYVDGVPYTKTDSVIGIWLYNDLTGRRHLCVVLRKRNMCKCGCRGWCTLHPVWQTIHWSMRAFASGRFPTERADGPWVGDQDVARARRGGGDMSCRGALYKIKGDLSEYSSTFGFPAVGSLGRPCVACPWNGSMGFTSLLAGLNCLEFPLPLNDDDSYEAACARCEIILYITEADRDELRPLLRYDKRSTASSGRRLACDVERLGLREGDRLEPSQSLRDIGLFERCTCFPLRVIFWRPQRQSIAVHRNPLFDVTIGISVLIFFFDILHTLHLGVILNIAREVIGELIAADAWRVRATLEQNLQGSTSQLKRELFNFYNDSKRRGEHLTEVADLTPTMLRHGGRPILKVKAAEAWGIFLFLPTLIESHAEALGDRVIHYRQAIGALIRHVNIMKSNGPILPAHACQQLMDTLKLCFESLELLNFHYVHKFHTWLHIVQDAFLKGNPWYSSCFLDESYNHTLKRCAKGCHAMVFERRLLYRMGHMMAIAGRKLRGRRIREGE